MLKKIIAIVALGFSMINSHATTSLQQVHKEANNIGYEVAQIYQHTGIKGKLNNLNGITKKTSKNVHKAITGSDISKGVQQIYKGIGAKSVIDTTSNIVNKTFSTINHEVKREYSGSFLQKAIKSTGKFISTIYEVTGIKTVVTYCGTFIDGFFMHFNR